MSNKRISALPEKQNPTLNDIVPIVDTQNPNNLATKRTTVGALLNLGTGGGTGGQGATGATGPRGATGVQGPAGTGVTGATGLQGATGPQGPAGSGVTIEGTATTWPPAANPAIGDMWLLAAPVPVGAPAGSAPGDGVVWTGTSWVNVGPIRGPQGAAGANGLDGATGATGPQGNAAPPQIFTFPLAADFPTPGSADLFYIDASSNLIYVWLDDTYVEVIGEPGLTGEIGATGPQGIQGLTGATGPVGNNGVNGTAGATGATGPVGNAGVNGATGATGPQGATGVGSSYDQSLNTTDNVTFNNVTLTSAVVVSGITNAGDGFISPVANWGNPGGTQWSDLNGTYMRTAVAVRATAWSNDGMHTPELGTHNYYLVQPDPAMNGVAFFLAPGNRTGWGTNPNDDNNTDPPVNYWRLCSGADHPRTYFTNPSSNPYVFPTTGWVPVSASAPNGNEGSGYNGAIYLPNYGGGFAVVSGGGTAQISGIGMMLPNYTQFVVGSFDNSTGGQNGLSLICAVGYELNWQGGRLKSFYNNATQTIHVDSPIQFNAGVLPKIVALTYASTLATDAEAGEIFDVTLTGNTTLANPTNPVDGKTIRWRITQDGTGSRTVTLGNKFVIPSSASSPLPFSTAANAMDVLAATYHAGRDKWDVVAFVMGY